MEVKKKIMYIHDEDYNYFTYSIIIILNTLGCYNEKLLFVDYRKLAIIINLMKKDYFIDLLKKILLNQTTSIFDGYSMIDYYPKMKQDIVHIRKIIFSLNKKGLITLKPDRRFNTVSLYLNKTDKIMQFSKNDLFADEVNRIKDIKTLIPRLRTLKYNTLLTKVYGQNEVTKWDV